MTALNDPGMLVQKGLEWFFDPKLYAPPDGRVAGSPESTQAEMGKQIEASESTQATMRKHIKASQRELAVVQDSVGAPCAPEVLTISDLAATPAAVGAFEVEKSTAGAFDILQQRIPFQPLSKLKFRIKFQHLVSS